MASDASNTQQQIFTSIDRILGEISGHNLGSQAEIVKNLAVAFRLAAGGPQPGGSVVTS